MTSLTKNNCDPPISKDVIWPIIDKRQVILTHNTGEQGPGWSPASQCPIMSQPKSSQWGYYRTSRPPILDTTRLSYTPLAGRNHSGIKRPFSGTSANFFVKDGKCFLRACCARFLSTPVLTLVLLFLENFFSRHTVRCGVVPCRAMRCSTMRLNAVEGFNRVKLRPTARLNTG